MLRKILAGGAIGAALVLAAPGTAVADVTTIGGILNSDGSLVQYATFRTHTFTGPISMALQDNTGTYTRLGLRDTSGNQFTQTNQWNTVGKQDFLLPGGSGVIPIGTQFAFNGRMGACDRCDDIWGGVLNY